MIDVLGGGVLVLSLVALAGCGSSEEPQVQRIAFCQGPSGEIHDDGFLDVEFRQGTTVVATGSVSVGTVLTAEVPVGDVQVYVDGGFFGAVENGNTDGPYHSPEPGEFSYYLASPEGCPATPPV